MSTGNVLTPKIQNKVYKLQALMKQKGLTNQDGTYFSTNDIINDLVDDVVDVWIERLTSE